MRRLWFDVAVPLTMVAVGSVLMGLGLALELGWLW